MSLGSAKEFAREAYSKIESNLRALLVHLREEASFFIGRELVGQGCGRSEGGE